MTGDPGALDAGEAWDAWEADIDVVRVDSGRFVAVLVLSPPPQLGPPLRMPIDGEYDAPELAEMAALDVFAAMTRRP
ncbi:hypothetical protein ACQ859_16560 [Roseateles chitinivorans]|uniref:hypothetical protein n=1 Tax=Roseateles chitinivorans TaxID=2917965 RepID=UPI003D674B3C